MALQNALAISAIGTAKDGSETTYDIEFVGTDTVTDAAGSMVLTTATVHGLLLPLVYEGLHE